MTAIDNLVHETSTSTGTGNFTLSAVDGRQTFNSAHGTGGSNVFYYFISHRTAGEWEVGTGSLSNSTTLVRDTVLASSNAGSAVNFSAGTKDVPNDVPASLRPITLLTTRGDLLVRGATDPQRLATGTNGQFLTTNGTDPSWGTLPIATSSEMETATGNALLVPPGRQHRHPGHPKGWVKFNASGTILGSYNVASVDDDGSGDFGVNWDTDFSSTNYAVAATAESTAFRAVMVNSMTAAAVELDVKNQNANANDPTTCMVVAVGDH